MTSTSLVLSWQPPVTPNGIISHYLISLLETNTGANFSYQAHAHTTLSVGDLHPFYTYMIQIYAVTVKTGPPSYELLVSTFEDSEFC